jgi:nucleotide-binding universal stress UspA family protein
MAAKAGREQAWLADATAELSQQTGAEVFVVSVDGLELEALSPTPRDEFVALARQSIDQAVARLRAAGVTAEGAVRSGAVVRGVLLYAEEENADLIVCGASTKSAMARRVLGSVPVELISRSRRPVLVITPPSG